jgi:VCBS repeat-containing protein
LWNDEIHTDGHLSIVDADTGESHAQTGVYYGTHGRVILQSNGDWSYFASIGQDATGRLIDHLGKGESLTDTVTVKSLDGTTHDIVVTIHGDNDRPYCSGEVQLNSGKEDLAQTITETELLANTIDVDTNDIGKLTITNLYADHGSVLDNHDGTYTFTPDADYNGQVYFTYDVQDAHGGVTHTGATTTLAAVNDAATLTSPSTSSVTEDHTRAANSSELWTDWLNLDIQDSDSAAEAKVIQIQVNGVTHTVPSDFAMDLISSHGTFHLTQSTDGHVKWAYTADNSQSEIQGLSHGESLTDTITLVTADGTKLPLTANIQGTDDRVIIDTPNAQTAPLGSVTEDVKNSVSGMLLAHDADSKDSVTFAAGDSAGKYGSLHVDADGHWHYDLDPAKANVLGQGQRFVEGFNITATSTDGSTSTQRVEVWVDGTDDHTIISGVNHGVATEDVGTHMSTHVNIMDAVDWQALQITDVDSSNNQLTVEFSGHQYTWNLGSDLDVTTPYGKFQFHTITSGPHQGEHSWSYIGDNKNSDVQGLKAGESLQETIKLIANDGTEFPIHVEVKGTEDGVVIDSTSELGHVTENAKTSATVSGQLNAHDTDIHDQVHWTATPTSGVSGSYGTFHVDTAGQWHYDVDQSKATELGAGDEKWEYFNVEAVSSDGSQVTKRVAVVVHGHNDNPTVTADVTLTAGTEDTPIRLTPADLLANATHVDNNDRGWLRVANLSADHGTVTTNQDGSFTFTPNQDYNGVVQFSYDVIDRHGGSTSAHASVSLQAVNDLPTIHGDSTGNVIEQGIDTHGSAVGQASVQGDLATIDPDVGDSITWRVGSQTGAYGHLTVDQNGHWVYQLNDGDPVVDRLVQGAVVKDTFVISALDSSGTPVSQTVIIDVHGSNDGAIIDGQKTSSIVGTLTEDAVQSTLSGHLQLSDADSGESLFTPLSSLSGTYGNLSLDANGDWTYSLDNQLASTNALQAGQIVTERFTIQSPDGTATKTIEVRVHGHDDLATLTVHEGDRQQDLDLFAGIQGSAINDLQYSLDGVHYSQTLPAGFVLASDGHTMQVDASNPNYNHLANGVKQSIYVKYQLQEGSGANIHTSNQHALIEIIGTSDKPSVNSFSPRGVQYGGPVTGNLLVGASDPDDNAHLVLSDIQYQQGGGYHTLNAGQSHTIANVGTLSISANGDYSFDPVPGFTGQAPAMLYRVIDTTDSRAHSAQQWLTITVDANHRPQVNTLSATFDEDTDLVISQTDFGYQDTDSDPLNSITITHTPEAQHGHLILNGHVVVDGQVIGKTEISHLIFRPLANYNGSATFAYTANDGHSDSAEQHAQLTITSINDAPQIHVIPITPTTGTLSETDVDVGDTHSYQATISGGQFGQLMVDPDSGAYRYIPNGSIQGMKYDASSGSYSGKDIFEVSVTDAHGAKSNLFITFSVDGQVSVPSTHGGSPLAATTVNTTPHVSSSLPTQLQSSGPQNSVTIDLQSSSDTGLSQTDDVTRDQTPTITGHTVVPFSQVDIYEGKQKIGSGFSDASGAFHIDVSSLADGVHNLTAMALAPSDVAPVVSALLPVTVDTQAPVASVSIDSVTADDVINAHESQSMLAVTGAVTGDFHVGDEVTVSVGGRQHSGKVDSHGHFSIDVPGSQLQSFSSITATLHSSDAAGNTATAFATHHYGVDTHVGRPTITFEDAGSDHAYSKAEIARGAPGTITATVHAAADATVGEHININGVDHVLDANSLSHGIELEVAPNTIVRAVMTDEHGNVNSNLNVAAGAKPEPIVVTAPSGSHHISASLGIPTMMPSQTPVPAAQQGWKIHVNGHYQTSYTSQWGTLTIDPQTGHLSYQEHADTHTGPHGSAQNVGVHEDHFEIALQGSHQDDVLLHVRVSILSHGPGHSGKLTLGSEVLDMTVTPIASHPASPPPPPPVTQADDVLNDDVHDIGEHSLTILAELGISAAEDSQQVDAQSHENQGASSYLDKLGLETESGVHSSNEALPDDIDVVFNQSDEEASALASGGDISQGDGLLTGSEQDELNTDKEDSHHHNDDPTLPDDTQT